mgnify:CR=1 FL=1
MKEPGKGELAQLFISIIGKEVTIEETSEISGLEIERIAELISSQDSLKFFNKKGKKELKICCDYSWVSRNLSQKIKLRTREIDEIDDIMKTKFPKHAEKYWSENKEISRDLMSRTLGEWIESELSSDQRWATLYAKSQDQLADMAMEARADYDAGKTEDLNPDSL